MHKKELLSLVANQPAVIAVETLLQNRPSLFDLGYDFSPKQGRTFETMVQTFIAVVETE